jgi:hypothetical protein
MFVIIMLLMIVAGVWAIWDRFFGSPKPTIEQWRALLRSEAWYIELLQEPGVKELVDNHRGIQSFLYDPYEIQKLLEKEDSRNGFIRYVRQEARTAREK